MSFAASPLWVNGSVILVVIAVIGVGAYWIVESAVRIAGRLGVSELVIGLTVIALGTSAPEFAVTLIAAFRGHADISVSNIVGSNIFNLGFILGGCALVCAIPTDRTLLRRDGAVLGLSTLLLLGMIGWDLRLDWYDGVALLAVLGVYVVALYQRRHASVESTERAMASGGAEAGDDRVPGAAAGAALARAPWFGDALLLLVGLAAVVAGSHVLVEVATAVARDFGVSEWLIGVTIVAAGTSAPELATSLTGAIRGRYAISAGSVIGSDIFNLLGVLGLAGVLRTLTIDPVSRISLAALAMMVFLVLYFMRTDWRISRMEGLVLVAVAMARWGFAFATN